MVPRGLWLWEQVHWGVTECSVRGCSRPAELLYEGEPVCFGGMEAMLDRQEALLLNRGLAGSLPPVECSP